MWTTRSDMAVRKERLHFTSVHPTDIAVPRIIYEKIIPEDEPIRTHDAPHLSRDLAAHADIQDRAEDRRLSHDVEETIRAWERIGAPKVDVTAGLSRRPRAIASGWRPIP